MNQLRTRPRRPVDPTKYGPDARRDIVTPRELAAQSAAMALTPLEGDDYTERYDVARLAVAIGMLAAKAQSLTVTLTPLQMVEVLGLEWWGDTGMERVDNALASLVSLGVVEILARESHAVYERRDKITVMVRE
jgi:hypothetical protein